MIENNSLKEIERRTAKICGALSFVRVAEGRDVFNVMGIL